jgi:hypothetical protein
VAGPQRQIWTEETSTPYYPLNPEKNPERHSPTVPGPECRAKISEITDQNNRLFISDVTRESQESSRDCEKRDGAAP